MTLDALVQACEGNLELNCHGIVRATAGEDYETWLEMQDGRRISPRQLDKRTLEDAIFEWRQRHPAFFQRIIGAMM